MYLYDFMLRPANKSCSINYLSLHNSILEAISRTNAGVTYTKDSKSIELVSIEGKEILLRLHCKFPLTNATRSLSAFSRELLKDKDIHDILNCSIYNKSLFSVQLLSEQNTSSKESMSDADLIKAVVDLVFTYTAANKKDADARASAIDSIKEIIAPYYKQ